ncbi:MAG: Ig-like domain-containing protein [Actinomycetia bacterium]|nr:Ig-like domain-containing protein [Actinomycetes bacterium]
MITRSSVLQWRSVAAVSVACLGLAACTTAGADGGSDPASGPPESRAVINVPSAKDRALAPTRPLVVKAEQGVLTDVVVSDDRGRKISGDFSSRRSVWRSDESPLQYDSRYDVTARAADSDGVATQTKTWVRTVEPKRVAYTGLSPYGETVVGVGMPVIMTFDQPVQRKAAVEKNLSVATKPAAVGGWYWVNDQMVRWRPKEYWKPGTDVTVRSRLEGVNLGDGVWGDDNDLARFSVGDSTISTVNIGTSTMAVEQNGNVVRKIPVTTGKPGWETRIGTKVIISKQRQVVMDAATIDVDKSDPEYYRLDVEYAMRLTWSGEYVHAAPWSVESQGVENVSHGCTGMSTEDASWFYNLAKPGDIVNYVNGSRAMEPWNGYTDWNISWQQWKKGSALS